ncbi:hypothetical protein DICA3_D09538 [Diutina catenulata]
MKDERPVPKGMTPYPPPHPQHVGTYFNPIQLHPLNPPMLSQPQHAPPALPQMSRQRMRVTRACDRCRGQKIKCSGTNPCVTCTKHKKECVYSTTMESTPVPTVKRPRIDFRKVEPFGLPQVETSGPDYVRHLENRVHYLESLLATRGDVLFESPNHEDPLHPDISDILYNKSAKWRYSRRHQNSLIIELCKSIHAQLSDENKAKVEVPRTQYFAWNMSGTHYLAAEELPEVPDLGDLDTAAHLDYFFEEINPLFAILHEAVFREQLTAYNQLMSEEAEVSKLDSGTQSKVVHSKLFSALLTLCYVLAIRMQQMSSPQPNMEMFKLEDRLFKYAHRVVERLSFEWESFELIQAWLLITLYLRIAYRQTSMYSAFGRAVIMSKSMGLGRESQSWITCTKYEELKAKRIFWAVYSMDRVLGLQSGRYNTVSDGDRTRSFPPLIFPQSPRDNWLTLPAFAMIQIARVANFVHTSPTDVLELAKVQQINTELSSLHAWLDENGFANPQVIKGNGSTVYAQVKLYYYDLVISVHGKALYSLLGRYHCKALKLTMVVDAFQGVIDIIDRIHKAGKLFTPWWIVMLLLFNAGIGAVCLIHGGMFIGQARDILKNAVKYLKILRRSPIKDDAGKVLVKERFKMVKESIWAIKTTNHILSLRLQEDMAAINSIGTDHGSNDVNTPHFNQLGVNTNDAQSENDFEMLLGKNVMDEEDEDNDFDDLVLNLQWFDQWGDFDIMENLDDIQLS